MRDLPRLPLQHWPRLHPQATSAGCAPCAAQRPFAPWSSYSPVDLTGHPGTACSMLHVQALAQAIRVQRPTRSQVVPAGSRRMSACAPSGDLLTYSVPAWHTVGAHAAALQLATRYIRQRIGMQQPLQKEQPLRPVLVREGAELMSGRRQVLVLSCAGSFAPACRPPVRRRQTKQPRRRRGPKQSQPCKSFSSRRCLQASRTRTPLLPRRCGDLLRALCHHQVPKQEHWGWILPYRIHARRRSCHQSRGHVQHLRQWRHGLIQLMRSKLQSHNRAHYLRRLLQ